mmetsp:Transcript_1527/g.4659  ORF Transcript_1527/g.4659 Transcript_1527/m.4659 type:complete len:218 (-) Transcript_1527:165-818(-)
MEAEAWGRAATTRASATTRPGRGARTGHAPQVRSIQLLWIHRHVEDDVAGEQERAVVARRLMAPLASIGDAQGQRRRAGGRLAVEALGDAERDCLQALPELRGLGLRAELDADAGSWPCPSHRDYALPEAARVDRCRRHHDGLQPQLVLSLEDEAVGSYEQLSAERSLRGQEDDRLLPAGPLHGGARREREAPHLHRNCGTARGLVSGKDRKERAAK